MIKSGQLIVVSWQGRLKWIMLIAIVHLCCFATKAQKISAVVDREKILLGEQIELQLRVDDLDRTKTIDKWFNLPDSINHIEVVERLPIDTIKTGNTISYVQKIKITSFDSGYWQLPALEILMGTQKKVTPAIGITVLPVDVSNVTDYHTIKDILEVELENDWRIIAALVALALISFFAMLWFLYKKKSIAIPKPKKNEIVHPYEWAMQQLQLLQQKNLIATHQHKLFYTELISICRNFSDAQLLANTNNKTTDEYMLWIKGRIGNEPEQVKYFQLLRLGNAVKYAKYTPATLENDEAFATAKNFINTLYNYHTKNNAV
jgi:hypothetical protein